MAFHNSMRTFVHTHISKTIATYISEHPDEKLTQDKITSIIYNETAKDTTTVVNGKKSRTSKTSTKPPALPCKWTVKGKPCPKNRTLKDITGFCPGCKRRKEVSEILENEKRVRDRKLTYSQEVLPEENTDEKETESTNGKETESTNEKETNRTDEKVDNIQKVNVRLIDADQLIYEDLDTHIFLKKHNEQYVAIGKLSENTLIALTNEEVSSYRKVNIHYNEDLTIKVIPESQVTEPSPVPAL